MEPLTYLMIGLVLLTLGWLCIKIAKQTAPIGSALAYIIVGTLALVTALGFFIAAVGVR